jgi:hypothetical protein
MVFESEIVVDDGVVLLSSLITSKEIYGKQLTLHGKGQEMFNNFNTFDGINGS